MALPCPPLLIVENTSDEAHYVAVYTDFLMSHTNRKTCEVYAQGLRRFCAWVVTNNNGLEILPNCLFVWFIFRNFFPFD